MGTKTQILLTIFTLAYLLTVLFTDISLTGFWTDIMVSMVLAATTAIIVFKRRTEKEGLTTTLRALTILSTTIVLGLVGLSLINPFAWDTLKMRSFYFQSVEGRLFNAYFRPVGAYAGGEGSFWITESPKFFPIVEIEKFRNGAVLWDFTWTEWEGKPVDQTEIVKGYMRDEIIEKVNK